MKTFFGMSGMIFVVLAGNDFADNCPPGKPVDQCVTVEAPHLPGEGGVGGIIIDGTIGSGIGGGAASATSALALNAKGKQKAKEVRKRKKDANEADETSFLDSLLALLSPEVDAVQKAVDKLEQIFTFEANKTSFRDTVKRDKDTGNIIEETHEGSCLSVSNGEQKKPTCTEVMGTKWKDPSDGKQKMVITLREYVEVLKARPTIQGKYERKYGDAITFVVETPEDIGAFFSSIDD